MPDGHRHTPIYNLVLVIIFGSVLFMGLNNIDKSVSSWLQLSSGHFGIMVAITLLLTGYLGFRLLNRSYKK